jgi:hypothetical protein
MAFPRCPECGCWIMNEEDIIVVPGIADIELGKEYAIWR